jgi:hypothetical protein
MESPNPCAGWLSVASPPYVRRAGEKAPERSPASAPRRLLSPSGPGLYCRQRPLVAVESGRAGNTGDVKLLCVVIAALSVGFSAAVSAPTPTSARVLLQDRDPITIAGARFQRGERVRVTLVRETTSKRIVRAGRRGTFLVTFPRVTTTRCDLFRVVAVGSKGSRAVLKILPAPACSPGYSR